MPLIHAGGASTMNDLSFVPWPLNKFAFFGGTTTRQVRTV